MLVLYPFIPFFNVDQTWSCDKYSLTSSPTDPTLPASTPSFDFRRHCPPHSTTSLLHTPFFTPLIRISLRITLRISLHITLHISLHTELSKAGCELF